MVKLYNLSSMSDEVLRPVLELAKKSVGCHGNVVVKVTKGGRGTQSKAVRCDWVYKWYLSKRRCTKASHGRELKEGKVLTDKGYVILSPHWMHDPLKTAEEIFEVAVHEFAHIRDYQKGEKFGDYLKHWKNRPHERRAVHATQEAMKKIERDEWKRQAHDEAILNLALEIERIGKEKRKCTR